MKIILESSSPEVGPFYVIDGEVFPDTESIRDIETNSLGNKDSDETHYRYWKILKLLYPEFKNKDYDYYPRGRVVYSNTEDIYKLFVDPCVSKSEINKIISELNLPKSKVKVDQSDEHYHCSMCNPNYVGISENY